MIDTPAKARQLARAIVADIRLYNAEKIQAGADLSEHVQEGRTLFRARVSPALHEVFEQEAAPLGGRAPTPTPAPSPGPEDRFGSFYAVAQPAQRRGSPLVLVVLAIVAFAAAIALFLLL